MLFVENNRPELKLVSEPQQLLTLFTVQPDEHGHEDSSHVHIILVQDCSPSMGGERINKSKLALQKVLEMLRPEDLLSLVRFNETSVIVFPRLKIEQRHLMEAGISSIAADGNSTLIYTGLEQAKAIITPGERTFIVLMSDGESFSQEHDFRLAKEIGSMGIPIFCAMIGADSPQSQKTHSEIARLSNGLAENLCTPDDIHPFLSQCFKTAQSNAWENVTLEVEAVGGAKLLDWAKYAPVIDPQKLPSPVTSHRIALGTITANESYKAVAKFQIPPKNQPGEYLIAKITANYNAGPNQKTATAEVKARISANAKTPTLNNIDEAYIAVEAKRAEQRGDMQTTKRLYLTIREKELANLAGKIAEGSASDYERVRFEASSTRRARK